MAFALLCGLLAWGVTRRPVAGWFLFAILMSHLIRDASYGSVNYFFWPFRSFHQLLPPFYYFGAEICLYLLSRALAGNPGSARLQPADSRYATDRRPAVYPLFPTGAGSPIPSPAANRNPSLRVEKGLSGAQDESQLEH
jgi:hypothetical protein